MSQIKKKFISNNAIDGSKLKLLNEDALKATKADGSAVNLFTFSASDEFRLYQIPKLSVDPVADDDLARKAYVDAKVSVEAAARIAADGSLQANVDAEAAARIAAVSDEAAARISEDGSLTSRLSVEESARSAADTTLQANVDAEAAARISEDGSLTSRLSVEESVRAAADTTLQANVDAEAAARIAADLSLASRVDKVLSNVDPLALDSLTEILSAFQSADGNLESTFTTLASTNSAAISVETADRIAAVTTEAADRIAADLSLTSRLSVEESARAAAVSVEAAARLSAVQSLESSSSDLDSYAQDVRSDLDDEAADRIAADESLTSRLSVEESVRAAALSVEISARISEDGSLTSRLSVEESARAAALSVEISARISEDGSLTSRLSVEESARAAADTTLQANVDAEAAARISEDGSLTSRLSVEESARAAAVSVEAAARIAADLSLASRVDNALSNVDPVALDSLTEILSAFQSADSNLNSAITTLAGTNSVAISVETADRIAADESLTSRLSVEESVRAAAVSVETAARIAADLSLTSRLSVEESARAAALSVEISARTANDILLADAMYAGMPNFAKFSKTLDSADIANNYVDLSHVAIPESLKLYIDRLAIHEGDYSHSTVPGNAGTRITFSMPAEQALAASDKFYAYYSFRAAEQPGFGGGGSGGGGGGMATTISQNPPAIMNDPNTDFADDYVTFSWSVSADTAVIDSLYVWIYKEISLGNWESIIGNGYAATSSSTGQLSRQAFPVLTSGNYKLVVHTANTAGSSTFTESAPTYVNFASAGPIGGGGGAGTPETYTFTASPTVTAPTYVQFTWQAIPNSPSNYVFIYQETTPGIYSGVGAFLASSNQAQLAFATYPGLVPGLYKMILRSGSTEQSAALAETLANYPSGLGGGSTVASPVVTGVTQASMPAGMRQLNWTVSDYVSGNEIQLLYESTPGMYSPVYAFGTVTNPGVIASYPTLQNTFSETLLTQSAGTNYKLKVRGVEGSESQAFQIGAGAQVPASSLSLTNPGDYVYALGENISWLMSPYDAMSTLNVVLATVGTYNTFTTLDMTMQAALKVSIQSGNANLPYMLPAGTYCLATTSDPSGALNESSVFSEQFQISY